MTIFPRYVTSRFKDLKVGISSYSEDRTALEVIGNVGVGTTNPDVAVGTGNTAKLAVGVATANNIYAKQYFGDENNNFNAIGAGSGQVGIDSGAVFNILMGRETGKLLTTGSRNILMGLMSGCDMTTAFCNIGLGYNALRSATTGGRNIAIGQKAGRELTTGYSNIFLGNSAGQSNTSGVRNVVIGDGADAFGFDNHSGCVNVFIGAESARSNYFSGSKDTFVGNTFMGYRSGWAAFGCCGGLNFPTSTFGCNTIIGHCAGALSGGSPTSGYGDVIENVYIGAKSATFNLGGCNVLLGSYVNVRSGPNPVAGFGITASVGNLNIGIGHSVCLAKQIGNRQLAIGHSDFQWIHGDSNYNVGIGITDPSNAVTSSDTQKLAVGILTAHNVFASRYQGDENRNFFAGEFAGSTGTFNNTAACLNVAIGNSAGSNLNASGSYVANQNVLIGACVGTSMTTSCYNTIVGAKAGISITNRSAYSNVLLGFCAGRCITGSRNIAIGQIALDKLSPLSSSNIGIGYKAGRNNESRTTTKNISIGQLAGDAYITGGKNTFLGNYAGRNLSTGEGGTACCNILLGNDAGHNIEGAHEIYENVLLGNRAGYFSKGLGITTAFSKNVLIGTCAGRFIAGSCNIYIGPEAAATHNGWCNCGVSNIGIGQSVQMPDRLGSNQLAIGQTSQYWITGDQSFNVGIGSTQPQGKLDVEGRFIVSDGNAVPSSDGGKLVVTDNRTFFNNSICSFGNVTFGEANGTRGNGKQFIIEGDNRQFLISRSTGETIFFINDNNSQVHTPTAFLQGNFRVTGVSTFAGLVDVNNRIDIVGGANVDQLNVAGVSTFAGAIDANGTLDVDGHTELDDVNVSGVATFAGSASFEGNVSIAGTLTYEDVTNVDSIGIITAGHGLRVTKGGINVTAGISTFGGNIDANGNLDVDGQTDLDVLNVSDTATFSALVDVNNRLDVVGGANVDQLNLTGVSTFSALVDANNRLDVVGGANLDQLNISGVSTFSDNIFVSAGSSVGIGTDNPADPLHIFSSDDGQLRLESADNGAVYQQFYRYNSGTSTRISYFGFGGTGNDISLANEIPGGDVLIKTTPLGASAGAEENALQIKEDKSVIGYGGLQVAGVSTFSSLVDVNNRLDVVGGANVDQLNVSGVSTFAGNVGIGTTIATNRVGAGNTAKLAVGVVTSHNLYTELLVFSGLRSDGQDGRNIAIGNHNTGNTCTNNQKRCNVSIGREAGRQLGDAWANVIMGMCAGLQITDGDRNVAIGAYAMGGTSATTTGGQNFASGYLSLSNLTSGNLNIGLGRGSLGFTTTGSYNIGLGMGGGYHIQSGNDNIAIGRCSGTIFNMGGSGARIGDCNIFIGKYSKAPVGVPTSYLIIGNSASQFSSFNENTNWIVGDSNYNIGLGIGTPTSKLHVKGDSIVTGVSTAGIVTATNVYSNQYFGDANHNFYAGPFTGSGAVGISSGACFNIGIGYSSLSHVTTGDKNIVLGCHSGMLLTSASSNVLIGRCAGKCISSGNSNLALGYKAGMCLKTGYSNVNLGFQAGAHDGNSIQNVAIGPYAGYTVNNAGYRNIAIGAYSGCLCSSSTCNSQKCYSQNIFFGEYTFFNYEACGAVNHIITMGACTGTLYHTDHNQCSSFNTIIGGAAAIKGSGCGNVFLGSYANSYNCGTIGINNYCKSGGNNLIGIGHSVCVAKQFGNTQLAIGHASKQWIHGDSNYSVGIGITDPSIAKVGAGDTQTFAAGIVTAYQISAAFFSAGCNNGFGGNIAIGNSFTGNISTTNTGHSRAIAFGNNAGCKDTGHNNTFIGDRAGRTVVDGDDNIVMGGCALGINVGNVCSWNNIIMGENSAPAFEYGADNILMGDDAGMFMKFGRDNIGLGVAALTHVISGNNNIALGQCAGRVALGPGVPGISTAGIGTGNIFLGCRATAPHSNPSNYLVIGNGVNNMNGTTFEETTNWIIGDPNYNIGIGIGTPTSKLHVKGDSIVTGVSTAGIVTATSLFGRLKTDEHQNLYIGVNAGSSNTLAACNIAIGHSAGNGLCGCDNIIFGTCAGNGFLLGGSTQTRNILIGKLAGQCSTSSTNNVYLGYGAGRFNTSAVNNIAVGYAALRCVGSGSGNVALGSQTMRNATGGKNVALGGAAGYAVTGCYNLFFGCGAGSSTTSGFYNLIFGHQVQASSATADNELVIGCCTGRWVCGDSSFNTTLAGIVTAHSDGTLISKQLNVSGVSTAGTSVVNTLKVGTGLTITKTNETITTFHNNAATVQHILEPSNDKEIWTSEVSIGATNYFVPQFRINRNGPVEAYYKNGGIKLRTSGLGVTVYGQLDTTDLNVSGVSTFAGLVDVNNRIDIVGGANVDQLNVSGVSTFNGLLDVDGGISIAGIDENKVIYGSTNGGLQDSANLTFNGTTLGLTGNQTISGDIDVDGHTELDNVNVSGVSTFKDDVEFHGVLGVSSITFDKSDNSLKFKDTARLRFGNDNRLQIYYQDNVNYIMAEKTPDDIEIGTHGGDIIFETVVGSQKGAEVKYNSSVDLYYKNVKRLATSGVGATIYHQLDTTDLTAIGGNFTGIVTASDFVGGGINTSGTSTFTDEVILGGLTVSGVSTFAGLVDINAGGQANTFKVEDLTSGRVVLAGTGGELEDNANLTFNGSTLGVTGDASFSGDVSIGGTLTYEDVTNIDSVGLITARTGLKVLAGGADITGHTELDNVNISGVSTFVGVTTFQSPVFIGAGTTLNSKLLIDKDIEIFSSGQVVRFKIPESSPNAILTYIDSPAVQIGRLSNEYATFNSNQARFKVNNIQRLNVVSDGIEVSGVTDTLGLNVTTGVSTFSGNINANGNIIGDDSTNISGINSVTATEYYGTGAIGSKLFARDAQNNLLAGCRAGIAITTGDNIAQNNVVIGRDVARRMICGCYNVLMGDNVASRIHRGRYNLMLGHHVGAAFTHGATGVTNNIFIGRYTAASQQANVSNSIAIGLCAARCGTSSNSVILGSNAGLGIQGQTHSNNIFLGSSAGMSISTGGSNIAMGPSAGKCLCCGDGNVFLGSSAGKCEFRGDNNIAIGGGTLCGENAGEMIAGKRNYNIALGNNAGAAVSSGDYNFLAGRDTGRILISGGSNIAIGQNALNCATTSNYSIALGYNAARCVSTGTHNIAFGFCSLYYTTTGGCNHAFGNRALMSMTTGCFNVAMGGCVGQYMTTGCRNIFLGDQAACCFISGDNNIALGCRIEVPLVTGSNQLAIGNRCCYWLTGDSSYNVGIGSTTPQDQLDVGGTLRANGLNVSGVSTFVGVATFNGATFKDDVEIRSSSASLKINAAGTSELTSIYNNNAATLAINDTGAGAQIVLRGQSPKLIFDQTAGGNGSIYYDSTDLIFYSGVPEGSPADVEKVRFTSGGINVGGGVTASTLTGTLQTAAQPNITSLGTLSSATVSGNINANGNIIGDTSTDITGINTVGANFYYGCGGVGSRLFQNDGCGNFIAGTCAGVAVTATNDPKFNILIGCSAGRKIKTSCYNVMLGNNAGCCIATGSGQNTLIGVSAGNKLGQENGSPNGNTFLGFLAGGEAINAQYNVAIGHDAGKGTIGCTGGSCNIAMGFRSGCLQKSSNNNNIFIGRLTGLANSTGCKNIFMGNTSGMCNISGSSNFAGGYATLQQNTGGSNNIAIGEQAGKFNLTGGRNIFLGNVTGQLNTTGTGNVAIQCGALRCNISGTFNVAIGNNAGRDNISGCCSIYIGESAGLGNTAGTGNISLGVQSMLCSTCGSSNIAIGCHASKCNRANLNIAIGRKANGSGNEGGVSQLNLAIGDCALLGHPGGSGSCGNIAFGVAAGLSHTSGLGNIFIGCCAGKTNSCANHNVMIGSFAGCANSNGCCNVIIGRLAGQNGTASLNTIVGDAAGQDTSGGCNAIFGSCAGCDLSTGEYNVVFGANAGKKLHSGSCNIAIGNMTAAFNNVTGTHNIMMGSRAGSRLISGGENAFIGPSAGRYVTSGSRNFAVGGQSSYCLTVGNDNVGIGACSNRCLVSGLDNISIGRCAGYLNTNRNGNVSIGHSAGYRLANNDDNISIGSTSGGGCCSIAIGRYALSNCTNTGGHNIALGAEAGCSMTTGGNNVFVGQASGQKNSSGDCNISLGVSAGKCNQDGDFNISIGMMSNHCAETSTKNVAVGHRAQKNIETASHNVALGNEAGICIETSHGNVSIGQSAAYGLKGGSNNVSIGSSSGAGSCLGTDGATGDDNIFIGKFSGTNITTGHTNVFLGPYAGRSSASSSANNNIGIGMNVGKCLTTGFNNIFFGKNAGLANTGGKANIFMGLFSGQANAGGSNNHFIGGLSGMQNTTGKQNNFMGFYAGAGNTSGNYNIFFGSAAAINNTTGSCTVAIGHHAARCQTTANATIAVGHCAGAGNTITGSDNILVGRSAGFAITTAFNNIFMGTCAGANTGIATENTFIGSCAGLCNTDGNRNVFIGHQAGKCSTTGVVNVAIGNCAGCAYTNNNTNTSVGSYAGMKLCSGSGNTLLGAEAGICINTGGCNSVVGRNAGKFIISGSWNNVFGHFAGCKLSSGSYNLLMGNCAGYCLTGHHNVMMGHSAGFNRSGNKYCRNVLIGASAGSSAGTLAVGNMDVLIGWNAGCNYTGSCSIGIGHSVCLPIADGQNQLAIGHYEDRWIVGTCDFNVGIGITTPTSKLHVGGDAVVVGVVTATDFDATSDIRLKTNIQPIDDPIAKVIQIEGVSFNWKKDNQPALGVIADQVEKILPELVHGDDPKTVNYNGLIGLLIEVVKDQQKQINTLSERISKLE